MSRVITHRKLAIGGTVITNDMSSFKPPVFKKKLADIKGSYVGAKRRVGYDPLEWEAKGDGLDERLISDCLKDGQKTIVIYTEIGEDDGTPFKVEHTMTGEVEVEVGESKVGEDMKETTIKGVTVSRYKHVDTGKTIDEVDIPNGEYLIGGENIKNTIK